MTVCNGNDQSDSDSHHTSVRTLELFKVCTLTRQGRVCHLARRITGANGQCLTLMKSPDEEAHLSPSTAISIFMGAQMHHGGNFMADC